ncbi:MAG: hypothetical protein U0802_09205 [Candidatus Binatia bacterium]
MRGAVPLTLAVAGGRLQLAAGDGVAVGMRDAAPELLVERDGERQRWRADALLPGDGGWSALWPETGLRLELAVEERGAALVLRAALEHGGDARLRLVEVAPLVVAAPGALRVGPDVARWAVYRNGYQSWSGTRAYAVADADADPWLGFMRDMQTDPVHRARGVRGVFRSDLVSVVAERGGANALAIGFLDAAHFFSAVEVDARGRRFHRLAAVLDGDGRWLRPGERLELPPLWLAAGRDGWALLEAWAAACGETMRARIPERTPIGWCSWYYYFTRVSERAVLDNVESLRQLRGRVRCDYVQVDDGYQRAIGDWLEPNEKFPHGMRWLAQRIRAAGLTPACGWPVPGAAGVAPDALATGVVRAHRLGRPALRRLEPDVEPRAPCLRARHDARGRPRLAARAGADDRRPVGLSPAEARFPLRRRPAGRARRSRRDAGRSAAARAAGAARGRRRGGVPARLRVSAGAGGGRGRRHAHRR